MVMWQNKGREEEQRKNGGDQVECRGQGRALVDLICVRVYTCVIG